MKDFKRFSELNLVEKCKIFTRLLIGLLFALLIISILSCGRNETENVSACMSQHHDSVKIDSMVTANKQEVFEKKDTIEFRLNWLIEKNIIDEIGFIHAVDKVSENLDKINYVFDGRIKFYNDSLLWVVDESQDILALRNNSQREKEIYSGYIYDEGINIIVTRSNSEVKGFVWNFPNCPECNEKLRPNYDKVFIDLEVFLNLEGASHELGHIFGLSDKPNECYTYMNYLPCKEKFFDTELDTVEVYAWTYREYNASWNYENRFNQIK